MEIGQMPGLLACAAGQRRKGKSARGLQRRPPTTTSSIPPSLSPHPPSLFDRGPRMLQRRYVSRLQQMSSFAC